MKIISTNLGNPTKIVWNGKETTTGIYKFPVDQPILLESTDVKGDSVIDRKHHGGIYKAAYLFSADRYAYWKEKYPDLEWNWGMFGENLTIQGLDESQIRIGSIYRLGTALVQITQPREPCYKLGIRFKDQNMIKQFIDQGFPGTYVRVLENGTVKTGDSMELSKASETPLTVQEFYKLLYAKTKDSDVLRLALQNEAIPKSKREKLKKWT
ncbi:MOSC domain-containing protein [Muricauda ruestringensis]|uniref:MOSC domain-containing protein n=1 Tax=Flagellimonas ruestringensis TaxID=111501 RepID=UPI001CD40845|nr:MOSC domain-containing protein [Allomuricauda ruestringensis]MCA0960478.1 MOSC domain-containing protein [Allomuricauda ruestringensis]